MSSPALACIRVSTVSAGRTTNSATRANGMARNTSQPLPFSSPPAMPMTTASNVQARTSSVAAQASAMPPVWVRCIRRSVRMRASTGNAVIDIAAPMNSANGQKSPSGPRRSVLSRLARPMPRPKGSRIEVTDTEAATRPRPLTSDTSSSSPTTNMKSTSPMLASRERNSRVSVGKSSVLKSTQQAGAEQHAGGDLSDHGRDAHLAGRGPGEPGDDDDQGELRQDDRDVVHRGTLGRIRTLRWSPTGRAARRSGSPRSRTRPGCRSAPARTPAPRRAP